MSFSERLAQGRRIRFPLLCNLIYLLGFALVYPSNALAVQLGFDDVFSPLDGGGGSIAPQGIAFDPITQDLFVTTQSNNTQLIRMNSDGTFQSSFSTEPLRVTGIDSGQNPGTFLVVNRNSAGGRVQEVTSSGALVTGGIDFATGLADPEGVVFHADRGSIFVTNDDPRTIAEYSTNGTLIQSFSTQTLGAGIREPTGITVNPLNGNLLVSSDTAINDDGSEQIFEITPDGVLVSVTDLNSPNLLGGRLTSRDAEGLTVDSATNSLYVALERDQAIGVLNLIAPTSSERLVQLETGSPVGLSQSVSTPAVPFTMSFDYRFATTTGTLDVFLDGVLLDSLNATDPIAPDFLNHTILVDALNLLDLPASMLEFIMDGPTGSSIALDNIIFPGLLNGDFDAGNLANWAVDVSQGGSAGVTDGATLTSAMSVPAPSTAALLAVGFAMIRVRRWINVSH